MLNGYKKQRRLQINVSEKTLDILDEYTACESQNAFFQKIPIDKMSEITKVMDGELARLLSVVKLMDGFLEAANLHYKSKTSMSRPASTQKNSRQPSCERDKNINAYLRLDSGDELQLKSSQDS